MNSYRIRANLYTILYTVLLLALMVGCGGQEDVQATLAPTATPDEVEAAGEGSAGEGAAAEEANATPTATSPPIPTSTPQPTATPIPPEIDAELYYLLDDEGRFVVSRVTSPDDGWLVAYPSTQGEITPELALGYTEIVAGEQSDITLEIDAERVIGRSIQIALHSGRIDDSFEPSNQTLLLIETVNIDTPQTIPRLEVNDQAIVAEEGLLRVDKIQAQSPGWVLITHAEEQPSNDTILGYAPVKEGESLAIPIPFRWHEASLELDVHLWIDEGNQNELDWGEDGPVLFDGEPLISSVSITLPFEIIVYDQPAVDSVFIDRVITDEPGLIVVYTDVFEDDQVDIAIGYAPVEAGITENLVIDVNENAVTQRLLVTQNLDVDEDQILDFPVPDAMRLINDQVRVFPLRTDQGDFIVVSDQGLVNGAVTIPIASVSVPSWVVIYAADPDNPDQIGETVLGSAFIETGIQVDTTVDIGREAAGQTVFARLHVDNIEEETFEPERNDWPVQYQGRDIVIEFEIIDE